MKSDTPELGKLLSGKEERDAIHVAIVPVIAMGKLRPGQYVVPPSREYGKGSRGFQPDWNYRPFPEDSGL